ncbi:bifunctional glutamate N-acetyltransferase/amino-acid acetyltransferase ArgJ [Shimia sp. Alg240-R146]|uniref:bifunctional glutamate N-acetyltransferase/amino-acid acetyltransferase ArgJ n=1 Tax=Shimia sp. Alg240-R146 TaxID=2993449 RepID=UPI0022E65099|nr:bifunctional glutamate N-acetyltransferase/amino-acid acetyltransferase ArgJ [Shimia sp. Alg240-R146]
MATIDHVSPLAPARFPELPEIAGARFATTEAGVKYAGRKDVMIAELAAGTVVTGVFTKSATRSAAVLDCQEKIGRSGDQGAAIVVNAGNANAFTGKNGVQSTKAVTNAVAQALDVPEERVFSSSTGVIGEPLPHDRITAKLADMAASLSPQNLPDAAEAIRTTDTFAKGAARVIQTSIGEVKIAGIAKGSGMIAPDMATMLVYIFTDAKIERAPLQAMLSELNEKTFNSITVDSDTSTSDTLLLAATGQSGVDVTEDAAFRAALHEVMLDLAHQVVRDGEGATKFVEINVQGAASEGDARTHALAIANSPLVKTAIAGEDPNWGRIVMAIGKSGAAADRDLLTIKFGDILVAEAGWVSPDYSEDAGADYMKAQTINITVGLGLGGFESTVWTCDLTHGYITINADYRS